MAQVNTGMGWSAESSYLTQTSGVEIARISGLGGASYPNQPIAKNIQTQADCIAQGTPVFSKKNPADDYVVYVACMDDVDCLIFVTDNYTVRAIATTPGARLCVAEKKKDGSYGSWQPNRGGTWTLDSTTGLYYSASFSGVADYAWNILTANITYFSTIRAAMDAVVASNISLTKTSAGYAVACVAKWKTGTGTVITTPILISTDSEFADMTDSSGQYNLAKLNMLLQGRRFYMAFFDIVAADAITSQFPVVDLSGESEPARTLEQVFMTIISTNRAHVIIIDSPDPYEEEGAGSGEEGGDGEDLEDDEMGISHHAIPAAINTGFCRIYCPSAQQLRDLSNFLWSSQFDITAVKKLFANPMDSVLGLSAVPLTLSGANAALYLGGVDTQMSLPMVSYQSYQVPMGAITVKERWGSYLDYDPYTKFSIFLPFIGFKDLSADDIMGKQIILDYDVDILSGACTARLQAGGNVLYQWSGQCSIQLPVTASNWNQVFQNATSAALSAGLAVATGSAGPVLAGALAAEGVQAIMGKPRIERGGTASGASGWMGGLTPYLVRVTPEAIIPNEQNKFIGYPAFSSISLGNLTGYNEIASIHLEGIPATGAELEELESILKGGVIF